MMDVKNPISTIVDAIKEAARKIYATLSKIDVSNKTREKDKFTYLPWASAWAEIKKVYPDATYKVYPQILDELGNTRFWHDDGRTGWVEVGVTIEGLEYIEYLAIMDFRNKSIPADEITSAIANKSFKRCFVKACALHGLGLYIYEGEDLPEDATRAIELKDEIKGIVAKKVAISDKAKATVAELCRAAEKQAFPDLEDSLITGSYKNIDDAEILTNLKKQLMAVRK